MEPDRNLAADSQSAEPSRPMRREIDCAGEPGWMRQQPEIVVRQRVTIVEPRPERDDRMHG